SLYLCHVSAYCFYYTIYNVHLLFFFFSSRRRHTRCYRDWSSDVCSSDLLPQRGQKACMAEHRFFHQCIARANGYAMPARNATGFPNHRTAIPQHARIWILPVNRKSFVDLDVLTSLHTAAAENALIGIVSIERIRVVDFVGLRSKRDSLMLNGQQLRRVMDSAIAIVV